jgi:competence protein ComEC
LAKTLVSNPMEPAKTIPVILGTLVMVAGAVALWLQVGSGGDGNLHVYFFDVGQGDSALILTPEGRQVLVDGGPNADSAIQALSKTIPSGDRSLDLVVLTHLDSDHSRGLLNVLDQYDVGAVLAGVDSPDSAMRDQCLASLNRNDFLVIPVHAGYQIDLGSRVFAEVLNFRPGPYGGASANDAAVVLRLTYGEISFLLTADIEVETESYLSVGDATIRSTVLKAAHHGSQTSTPASFVDSVDPEIVIISVGQNNSFGHPNVDVLGRLINETESDNLYRTDRNGSVEFVTDARNLWVNTER